MIIMLVEAHYDDNGNDMNFVVRVEIAENFSGAHRMKDDIRIELT